MNDLFDMKENEKMKSILVEIQYFGITDRKTYVWWLVGQIFSFKAPYFPLVSIIDQCG